MDHVMNLELSRTFILFLICEWWIFLLSIFFLRNFPYVQVKTKKHCGFKMPEIEGWNNYSLNEYNEVHI